MFNFGLQPNIYSAEKYFREIFLTEIYIFLAQIFQLFIPDSFLSTYIQNLHPRWLSLRSDFKL